MKNQAGVLTPMQDTRGSSRVALLKPFRTSEGEGFDEMILDYSATGCRITSPVVYNVGDPMVVDLGQVFWEHTMTQPAVRFGRVVWEKTGVDGRGEYGIRFE